MSAPGLSRAEVCRRCGVSDGSFAHYLRRGIGDHQQRGARPWCTCQYAEAVDLYRTTPEPLKSIARRLGLVYNSLSGFVRRSCPDAIEQHNALTP